MISVTLSSTTRATRSPDRRGGPPATARIRSDPALPTEPTTPRLRLVAETRRQTLRQNTVRTIACHWGATAHAEQRITRRTGRTGHHRSRRGTGSTGTQIAGRQTGCAGAQAAHRPRAMAVASIGSPADPGAQTGSRRRSRAWPPGDRQVAPGAGRPGKDRLRRGRRTRRAQDARGQDARGQVAQGTGRAGTGRAEHRTRGVRVTEGSGHAEHQFAWGGGLWAWG